MEYIIFIIGFIIGITLIELSLKESKSESIPKIIRKEALKLEELEIGKEYSYKELYSSFEGTSGWKEQDSKLVILEKNETYFTYMNVKYPIDGIHKVLTKRPDFWGHPLCKYKEEYGGNYPPYIDEKGNISSSRYHLIELLKD